MLNMKTRIISAFPGAGKSYLVKSHAHRKTIVDLDSNEYTLGHDKTGKVLGGDFPANYIHAINDQLGKVDILLVSIHKEVRQALQNAGLEFTLVYPEIKLKTEYIDRFVKRKDPQSFIDLFNDNWDQIIEQLKSQEDCEHIVLKSGQYLNDVMTKKF